MTPTSPTPTGSRRELRTRARVWPRTLAQALGRAGITPNQVSLASIVFAGLGWWCFHRVGGERPFGTTVLKSLGMRRSHSATVWLLVGAAACIQLRLLCNLLDGLLAIEGGLKTKTGELYNEIPDRAADVLILVGSGYALNDQLWYGIAGSTLGWVAATLAILTAYVRLLGGSLGFVQRFSGPMAKQHRMFTLTVGTLVAAIETSLRGTIASLAIALALIIIGSALTLVLRVRAIASELRAR